MAWWDTAVRSRNESYFRPHFEMQRQRSRVTGAMGKGCYNYAKKCHGLKLTNGLGLVELSCRNWFHKFYLSLFLSCILWRFHTQAFWAIHSCALSLGFFLAFCLSFYIICILTREYKYSSLCIKIIIRFHNNI